MSNNLPVLSIIVPAYNAEKTLKRCLDSLLMQDTSKIEIIISNDGSTDHTQLIIDEYQIMYPCISGVFGINEGSSCARNRGIQVATGRWITFVDSDDYVQNGIYDSIIKVLLEAEPDMLEYQYYVSINGEVFANDPNELPKNTILDVHWLEDTIIPVALNISDKRMYFITNFVWNKVYKTDIIRRYNVCFDETRRKWEDRLFSLSFLCYAKTYYSMSEYGYYYVCGTGQSLSSKFDSNILRVIMDSYWKYRVMYGERYCFDNSYTTNYFCNLLLDVTIEQFAYEIDSTVMKNMLSLFVDNEQVNNMFLDYETAEKNRRKVCIAIQRGCVEDVYNAFREYSAIIQRKKKQEQAIERIRYLLSRAKRVIFHEK